MYISKNNLMKN